MSAPLIIRADASVRMGAGHLMRMLALAQGYRAKGGQVVFAVAETPRALRDRLTSEGFEVRPIQAVPASPDDAVLTERVASNVGAKWLAVDGYQFGEEYQAALKRAGLHVLMMDDYGHAGSYCADLVVNQNLQADAGWYSRRQDYTWLLLGTDYVLLREEFLERPRDVQAEVPRVAHRFLVNFGGTDPDNLTLRILEDLRPLVAEGAEVVAMVGGSNPYRHTLNRAAETLQPRLRVEVDVTDVPALMRWCDLAVAAGGSTLWELAFMGVPLIGIGRNRAEQSVLVAADRTGSAWYLGEPQSLAAGVVGEAVRRLAADPRRRAFMRRCAMELVDGMGTARVLEAMHAWSHGPAHHTGVVRGTRGMSGPSPGGTPGDARRCSASRHPLAVDHRLTERGR